MILFFGSLKFIRPKINFLLALILVSGLDGFISITRYILLSGKYYLGFSLDELRFIGVEFSKGQISLINQDFSSTISASFLRFDFFKIWNNFIFTFLFYPVVHLILSLILWKILESKLSKIFKKLIFGILFLGWVIWICVIFTADPKHVLPQI